MIRVRWSGTAPVLFMVAACSQSAVPPSPWSADAVRDLLEKDRSARLAVVGTVDDPLYCGVDLLGGSPDGRYVYVWAVCGTYEVVGTGVEQRSGVSVPVRIDTSDRSVELPGAGAAYPADIRRLFPPGLVDGLSERAVAVDRTQAQLNDRAAADLAPG